MLLATQSEPRLSRLLSEDCDIMFSSTRRSTLSPSNELSLSLLDDDDSSSDDITDLLNELESAASFIGIIDTPSHNRSAEGTSSNGSPPTSSNGRKRKAPMAGLDQPPPPQVATVPPKASMSTRGSWTAEENQLLRDAIARFPKGSPVQWRQVALHVGSRNRIQCRQRFKMVLEPGTAKGQWHLAEDQQLCSAVAGEQQRVAAGCCSGGHHVPSTWNWDLISAAVPGRCKMQVKDRWTNHLDPAIVHGPFTAAEDEMLRELQQRHGNKFAQIARQIPGRPLVQIKIRWRSMQRAAKRNATAAAAIAAAASVFAK